MVRIPEHIFYPALVVAILLVSVAAHVALIVMASRDGGPQVVPDYYQRGVHWDENPQPSVDPVTGEFTEAPQRP